MVVIGRAFAPFLAAVVLLAGCVDTGAGPVATPSPTPTGPTAGEPSGSPSPSGPAARRVDVFLPNDRLGDPCSAVFPVARRVDADDGLGGALEALLAGPTPDERAAGFGGFFGPATADLFVDVRVEQGRALVSFDAALPSVIPNASASCGSTSLLASLDATVEQFPGVDEAWYDLEGDRAEFYGWLQYAAPDDTVVPPPEDPTPSPTPSQTSPPTVPPGDVAEWSTLPEAAGRVVALTFDAGANGDAVPAILEVLAREGAPATFFLTGRWATAYPQLAAAIGQRHAVGNHSQSHTDLTTLDAQVVRDEVAVAEEVIASTSGDDPRPWFRFPYGARDARTLEVVTDLGYRSVRWTVDTLGWQGTSAGMTADGVVQRVVDALRPGAIVLMHVGSHPTDGSTLDADALPEVIRRVRAAGYDLVDLDEVDPGAPTVSSDR